MQQQQHYQPAEHLLDLPGVLLVECACLLSWPALGRLARSCSELRHLTAELSAQSRDQCYHFLFRDLHTEHLDIYSFSSVGGVEQCVHALVAAFDASQAVQWRFARHLHYRGVRGSRVRIAAPRDFLDWLFDTFSLADVTAYDE